MLYTKQVAIPLLEALPPKKQKQKQNYYTKLGEQKINQLTFVKYFNRADNVRIKLIVT